MRILLPGMHQAGHARWDRTYMQRIVESVGDTGYVYVRVVGRVVRGVNRIYAWGLKHYHMAGNIGRKSTFKY